MKGITLCLVMLLWVLPVISAELDNSSEPGNFTSIAYNVTDNGTVIEIYTEADNVTANETATTLSPTEQASTENPTAEPADKKSKSTSCTCDISDICNEDCCCDADCVIDGLHTLEECRSTDRVVLDERYCSNSKPKYDLFCVAYDNLQQRHYFNPPKKVSDPSLRNVKVNNPYSWTDDDVKPLVKTQEPGPNECFKTKGPIYVLPNGTEEPIKWTLPAAMFNDFCDSEGPVRYMVDASYQCLHSIDVISRCEVDGAFDLNRYVNLTFQTLLRDNSSNETTCDTNSKHNISSVPVSMTRSYIYHNILEGTAQYRIIDSDEALPKPVFDSLANLCRNAILSVSFVITHSGRQGIDTVHLEKFELADLSPEKPIAQTFSVKFKYRDKLIRRIENPGYKLGQYIVVGKNASQNESIKNKIISTSNFKTLRPNFAGYCQPINASESGVKFGINLNVGCALKVAFNAKDEVATAATRCSKLQEEILNYVFDFDNAHTFATFAKSNPDDVTDWVHIQKDGLNLVNKLVDNRVCHVITSLRIEIFHARTGLVASPQIKVLAISVKAFHHPIIICSGDSCPPLMEINLRSTVSYKDMTSKPSYVFGQSPKIRATLPTDFFYPFLSNAQSEVKKSSNSFLTLFVFVTSLLMS